MTRPVLALNTGSSTMKYTLIDMDEECSIEEGVIKTSHPDEVMKDLFGSMQVPRAIGHRLVHGGNSHFRPARIDEELFHSLHELIPLAPLHIPSALKVIEACQKCFPSVPQVACFDTAFHHHMPERAKRLALPRRYYEEGVQRYGFHGLSYEFIVSELGDDLPERSIIAHLGNGASMVALLRGAPIDTTMGMTPTGGFMMGTRCGDLDPGVLLYLMRNYHLDSDGLERIVNEESGLLGVSEMTSDMQMLIQSEEMEAREAVELFCYQARKALGSMVAILGGCDLLIFTGGIGEHTPEIRNEIAKGWSCDIAVVHTNEDLMIARHALQVVEEAE